MTLKIGFSHDQTECDPFYLVGPDNKQIELFTCANAGNTEISSEAGIPRAKNKYRPCPRYFLLSLVLF